MKPYNGETIVAINEYTEADTLINSISQDISNQAIQEVAKVREDLSRGSYIVTVTYRHSDYCECQGFYHKGTCQHYTPTY